ncbi:MAG: tetratricopeptide repeat protein, partial [Anaerolineae bacterium]|nr:tetratricopeptide repeat protein [Anaerolineae bacterium]
NLKQYDKALADYTRAIELNPEYADAFYNTACAYAFQNNVEAALSPLRRALELDPEKILASIPTDSDFDLIRNHPDFIALLDEFSSQQQTS